VTLLVLKSWLLLLYSELVMRFCDFRALHKAVRKAQVRSASRDRQLSTDELCHAVDLACVFYFKQVYCLQRSVVATLLLRRHGWRAEMVIGAQVLPPRSHAWVEVEEAIVNDKPYMLEIYQVLERC